MTDLYDALRERGCIDPVLFRAMVRSHIGKDCPFPTIKAAADSYGVHPEQLRMFVKGLRPAEPKLLAAFGLERVVLYALAIADQSPKGRDAQRLDAKHASGGARSAIAQTSPRKSAS